MKDKLITFPQEEEENYLRCWKNFLSFFLSGRRNCSIFWRVIYWKEEDEAVSPSLSSVIKLFLFSRREEKFHSPNIFSVLSNPSQWLVFKIFSVFTYLVYLIYSAGRVVSTAMSPFYPNNFLVENCWSFFLAKS